MRLLCLSIVFAASCVFGAPPPVPSAGVIEREIEKEYEAQPLEPDRQIPALQIDIPEEKLDLPDGISVYVSSLHLIGNESISDADIAACVDSYLGKELSLKAIYEMCAAIDQLYAERGYFLARSYPPPQAVKEGVLTIEVIEGRLGNITVVGNKHYTESFIRSYFSSLMYQPLQEKKFLRALMLLNENSDLMAGAIFEKGKEFGYADVILRVEDKRPVHLYLNGNNYGRNLTTNARVGARLDWGSLALQGDKLSIAEVVGFPVNALYFTDVTYTVPLNRNGASLEFAYLFSKFKIEELTSLHLRGRSDIATVKFNQALTRTRSLSLNVFSYFDYKQIQNFTLNHRTSFDMLRVLTAGMLLDHYQQGFGRDYLTVQFAAGIPDFLGGLKAVDSESSRAGGGGRFFILTADYDRIQHLPKDCFLYVHASGQLSPSKLTLPEQIYIGGVDTVRGFPLAVGLGDSGYYCNLEFRVPPPFLAEKRVFRFKKKWKEVLQFDVFLDHGGTFLQSIQNLFLWGSGLGVRLNGLYNCSFSIDVGFPLNHRDLTRGAFVYIKLTGQPF